MSNETYFSSTSSTSNNDQSSPVRQENNNPFSDYSSPDSVVTAPIQSSDTSATLPPSTASTPTNNVPAKKSRHSCGCWAAVILVCLLFLGAIGAFFSLAFSDFAQNNHSVDSTKFAMSYHLLGSTADTEVKSKIVVLPISGVISSMESEGIGDFCTPDALEAALDFIAQDEDVVALVLRVNSPGGGLTASDVMYHHLCKFKKMAKIPVYAFFEDSACSGGYYISMAADKIYACPTTMTGSIGVIMTLPEFSGLMSKVGVKVNAITSRNFEGKDSYKDIGSMFRAMKPQERELLQNMITESWQRFVQVVAEGRQGKLTKAQVERLADGRIFSANQAKKAHLIDEICYADDLYDNLVKEQIKNGRETPRAVILQRDGSFMDKFSLVGLRSWLQPTGAGLDVPQTAGVNRFLLSPVSGQLQ